MQVTQTSLEIRQVRSGNEMSVKGKLPSVYVHGDEQYLSTTLFLHYFYSDEGDKHLLKDITVCCVPNGLLQTRYNPNVSHGFWVAGRNAPSRGEEFRVRVSFQKLKQIANWKVQKIFVDDIGRCVRHTWEN